MKKSPYAIVKERFGAKENLIKTLLPLLEKTYADETKDEFKERITRLSNRKLLRLHELHTVTMKEFGGSKQKLVSSILEMRQPPNSKKVDQDFNDKLMSFSLTRLVDMHTSLKKKAHREKR